MAHEHFAVSPGRGGDAQVEGPQRRWSPLCSNTMTGGSSPRSSTEGPLERASERLLRRFPKTYTSPVSRLGLVNGVLIHGVELSSIQENADDRGVFAEYFVLGRDLGIEPVQWSVVRSRQGTLRGMHFHVRHDEYFALVSGRATVGLHDLRPDSPTFGGSATYEFSEKEPSRLIFPAGLVHGWLFHKPSVHLQATSEAHDHYGPDDNNGCRWDDPALGITWPFEPTILSARAAAFGTLEQLRHSDLLNATACGQAGDEVR